MPEKRDNDSIKALYYIAYILPMIEEQLEMLDKRVSQHDLLEAKTLLEKIANDSRN